MKNNPLLDYVFLKELDNHRNRTTYARITNLTTEQYPIERIEGIVTAGSINIDSKSAVRRVLQLTLTTDKLNINNIYWGLSTRIKVEIGLENKFNPNYENIIWFPQGVFIITDFKTSGQVKKYQITVSAKDKMCLLNGDVGGNFNAETQLDIERIQLEDGTWVDEKKPIAYIIREMIHHYAQESFHNIIIRDIDTLSLKVMRNYKTTFYLIKRLDTDQIVEVYYDDLLAEISEKYQYYLYPNLTVNFKNLLEGFVFDYMVDEDDTGLISYEESKKQPWIIFDKDAIKYTVIKIESGEDIGYQLTETYYPDELIAGVNDTVTSVLDKIVKTFGAFEYFYNLDGQFVFQAKETYVNTSWNNMYQIENEQYIAPAAVSSKVKYMFEGSELTTAYQNAPKLGSIKNDFTVWGTIKSGSGNTEIPIHMRYAIDRKPEYYHTYDGLIYITNKFFKQVIQKNEKYKDLEGPTFTIEGNKYKIEEWREIIYQMAMDYYQHNHDDDFEIMIQRHNIDSIFNVSYYERGKTGYEQYYHDIEGFWRTLYAPEEEIEKIQAKNKKAYFITDTVNLDNFYDEDNNYIGPWNKNIVENPSTLIFWFDFFESENLGLGQFSVPAIGSRPKNVKNDKVQALIYKDVPDIVFVSQEDYDTYKKAGRLLTGYDYIITDDFIEECLANDSITISTRSVTAQEQIDELLYNNAYCNETVTITSVPIYYLEPNTIISAKDELRMVNGYYIINKVSLPLAYKGTMKITAIKVPERIY